MGLWFAALFGLGSLAIRTSLIEGLVVKLHIDLILPAAAPPLGFKAHVLIALAMSIGGGVLGLIIARRIARPKPIVQERRRGHAPVTPEATAQEATRGHEAQTNRRKRLAITEDHAPDYAQEFAPLPGGVPQILDVTQCDFAAGGLIVAAAAEPGTLDLSGFLSDVADSSAHLSATQSPESHQAPSLDKAPAAPPAGRLFDKYAAQALLDQAHRANAAPRDPQRPFAPPPAEAAELHDGPAAASPMRIAAEHDGETTVPPPVQAFAETDGYPALKADALAGEPAEPLPAPIEPTATAAPTAAHPLADVLLDDLSSLQLIERLAQSLQKRRQRPLAALPAQFYAAVGAAVPVATEVAEPEHEEVHAGADVSQPVSASPTPITTIQQLETGEAALPVDGQVAIVPPPIAMPAALRPVGFDFPEDESVDLTCSLPPRGFSMTAELEEAAAKVEEPVVQPSDNWDDAVQSPPEDNVPEDEAEDSGNNYSSLLALNNPPLPRQGYIRIDEAEAETAAIEPVVVFPGQAARAFAAPSRATAIDVPADLKALASRRFDAPPVAMAPGVSFAAQGQSIDDREETTRALRTALATLQRMSGAA